MLQLPRCLVRICNLFYKDNQLRIGKFQKIQFASQMWATRPHLGSIFEKLLHRKTFSLPAAYILQPIISKTTPAKQKVDDIL